VIITTEEVERLAAQLGGHAAALDATAACLRSLAAQRHAALLNPDRWRGAINDALTNWLSPIEDHETPADALQRLIRLEVNAALDPKVSQSAADLVAQARRDALEELERHFKEAAASTPLGHEDRQRGASTYNWLMYCVVTINTMKGEGGHPNSIPQAQAAP
jgi:hypothetical protein